jgi:hypothetical protein
MQTSNDKGPNRIHQSNLESALHIAIRHREEYEREKLGHNIDSAFLAGLRENLARLEKGERLEVVYE